MKAWSGLYLPSSGGLLPGQYQKERRSLWQMEFKTYVNHMIKIPCQIVRQGRRILYRVLNGTSSLSLFFRLSSVLRC